MADYYLVGASGNWQGGTIWATSSGGTPGAHTPGAGDNVHFDLHSTGTVTVGTASTCNNMTITSAGAFTITMGSTAVLTISGSLSDDGSGTWSPNSASQLIFNGTLFGLTFRFRNSFAPGIVKFNGAGGSYILTNGISATGAMTFSNPNITLADTISTAYACVGALTVSAGSFNLGINSLQTQASAVFSGASTIITGLPGSSIQASSGVAGSRSITFQTGVTATLYNVSVNASATGQIIFDACTITLPAYSKVAMLNFNLTNSIIITSEASILFGGIANFSSSELFVGPTVIPNLEGV